MSVIWHLTVHVETGHAEPATLRRLFPHYSLRYTALVNAQEMAAEMSRSELVSHVTVTQVTETDVGIWRRGARSW
jgi:hypothetical protein